MGISIAICELDSEDALCKKGKTSVIKVHLDSVVGYEQHAEFDEVVGMDDAKRIMAGDWEGFLKRNRMDGEQEIVYLEKVKNDADRKILLPAARRQYTGWITLAGVPEGMRAEILRKAGPDNRLTDWDMLSFDELNETCGKCPLSWDSARGCIGTFGPEKSALLEIAAKHGCSIVAGIPAYVKERTKLTVEDAKRLLEEVKVLRE
ncbi:MAG: hypothetical protein FJ151_03270, partial [Euryarchaeota archaeon]|nr:hypothetical protein [Euryarchaeota archaeon]